MPAASAVKAPQYYLVLYLDVSLGLAWLTIDAWCACSLLFQVPTRMEASNFAYTINQLQ